MTTLTLRVKTEYFDQIKDGEKTEEYRLCSSYWQSRIAFKKDNLTSIRIILGYPRKEEMKLGNNVLVFPWRGYEIKTICHKQFSKCLDPRKVYAIKLFRGIGGKKE